MAKIAIFFILSVWVLGCSPAQKVEASDPEKPIAVVNGETISESDLERSQVWLPAFARQLESNSNIEITRFWSLIQIVLMAQDARKKGLLSEAERDLAIKEALAADNINHIPYPNFVIQPEEIDAYISAHPDEFFEPEAFTVNYALIKNEKSIPVLTALFGLANGAQMGYNIVDPPELDKKTQMFGPLTSNIGGHSMSAKKFNFAFATINRENTDEPAQLGPFTAKDGLLFSCPEAIEVLKTAKIGQPINRSIACSGDWKAFVIPEWRRDAAPMTPEKARQTATEKLMEQRRAAFRETYIQKKLDEAKTSGT